MRREIDTLIQNNPILQLETSNTHTQTTPKRRTKSVPLSKMKSKHSLKHTSSEKYKKRKTTAQRDIPQMQLLEEEDESYDQPLRSQRLTQKKAAKKSHDIEETPSKKTKKVEKVKSPTKETTKETKKPPRAPEKGVVIKEVQEPKPKKLEDISKDKKGKGKVHEEQPLKDKKWEDQDL